MGRSVEVAWMNGRLVDPAEMSIPLMSNAVFRGTSVFDVMPVAMVDGTARAIGLDPHLARLLDSARWMGLETPFGADELCNAVHLLGNASDAPQIVRTVIANAGGSGAGAVPDIVVAMTIEPWSRTAVEPLRLQTARAKIPADILPPAIKVAASYAAGLRAESAAIAAGFDGIVNLSADGDLVEGVSSSIGVVIDGVVRFPAPQEVLDSISRRLIEDVAAHEGIPLEVGAVPAVDLTRATGALIASSTKIIAPVRQIGSVEFEPDEPVLRELSGAVEAVVAGEHALSETWLTPLVASP